MGPVMERLTTRSPARTPDPSNPRWGTLAAEPASADAANPPTLRGSVPNNTAERGTTRLFEPAFAAAARLACTRDATLASRSSASTVPRLTTSDDTDTSGSLGSSDAPSHADASATTMAAREAGHLSSAAASKVGSPPPAPRDSLEAFVNARKRAGKAAR